MQCTTGGAQQIVSWHEVVSLYSYFTEVASKPSRARLLCRSVGLAPSAAIFATTISASYFIVLYNSPSSRAYCDHPLIRLDAESSDTLQKTPYPPLFSPHLGSRISL